MRRELLGDPRTPGDAAFIASHRGGGATAPENTLPAIRAALSGGFDYVEVDVALTADRQPVLMHDAKVDRTTDGHGRLASLTLAEVRALDAGSWFDPEFAGTQVPTFAEFLDVLAASGHRAIIELKGLWDAEAVTAAIGEVAARNLERRVAIASFDARTLAHASAASEVVPRLLILKNVPDDVVAPPPKRACAASSSIARRCSPVLRSSTRCMPPVCASWCTRSTGTRSGTRSRRSVWTASSPTTPARCRGGSRRRRIASETEAGADCPAASPSPDLVAGS